MKTIKNLQNLIKLIKKVHTQSKINKYNIYTNLRYMDKESARIYNILNLINKYKAEFFMKLMEIFIKNRKFTIRIINIIFKIFSFIKEFIIYLIEKHCFKFNFLYFSLKAAINEDTLDFFIILEKIKSLLNFDKKKDETLFYLICGNYILLVVIFLYIPASFHLIYTLSGEYDPKPKFFTRPSPKYY